MTPERRVQSTPAASAAAAPNRWITAVAGILMQVALGAVYAWSVFRAPLSKQFGWSIGGLWLKKQVPG